MKTKRSPRSKALVSRISTHFDFRFYNQPLSRYIDFKRSSTKKEVWGTNADRPFEGSRSGSHSARLFPSRFLDLIRMHTQGKIDAESSNCRIPADHQIFYVELCCPCPTNLATLSFVNNQTPPFRPQADGRTGGRASELLDSGTAVGFELNYVD